MKRQQPERYQDIPIPDALGDVIDRAAARAKHQRRRRPLVRTGICAAAALCVLTVTANSPLAAQAVHIPVLGTVVQMLHIGSGGVQTDGLAVHAAGRAARPTSCSPRPRAAQISHRPTRQRPIAHRTAWFCRSAACAWPTVRRSAIP